MLMHFTHVLSSHVYSFKVLSVNEIQFSETVNIKKLCLKRRCFINKLMFV